MGQARSHTATGLHPRRQPATLIHIVHGRPQSPAESDYLHPRRSLPCTNTRSPSNVPRPGRSPTIPTETPSPPATPWWRSSPRRAPGRGRRSTAFWTTSHPDLLLVGEPDRGTLRTPTHFRHRRLRSGQSTSGWSSRRCPEPRPARRTLVACRCLVVVPVAGRLLSGGFLSLPGKDFCHGVTDEAAGQVVGAGS